MLISHEFTFFFSMCESYDKACEISFDPKIFYLNLYILRGFRKLVTASSFFVKNIPKLINQQLKNEVKIIHWKKQVSYCFLYCKKYPYLKLQNGVKIVIDKNNKFLR